MVFGTTDHENGYQFDFFASPNTRFIGTKPLSNRMRIPLLLCEGILSERERLWRQATLSGWETKEFCYQRRKLFERPCRIRDFDCSTTAAWLLPCRCYSQASCCTLRYPYSKVIVASASLLRPVDATRPPADFFRHSLGVSCSGCIGRRKHDSRACLDTL
jgi:hypothetical protein